MCRIAGIIDRGNHTVNLESIVKNMCESMAHGGPDGEGLYFDASMNVVFGHRRLALLDLSEAGHQPMTTEDGNTVISYNGEIYNYPQLKKELENEGYSFKTVCDTEMIIVAYSAWGVKAFNKFIGMFALALFDKSSQKIYLVRDGAGIKPLYYFYDSNKLSFASEVRAFKYLPGKLEVEPFAKILFLAYGHIPEPYTSFKDIKMLAKGSFMEYDITNHNFKIIQYEDISFTETENNIHHYHKEIRNLLFKSVKDHLLADAPIGVFLSGGIDSSLLTLIASQVSKDLNTLSLYFNEANFNEKKYQDLIIEKINCKSRQFLLNGEDFNFFLKDIIENMDLPSTDGINTWFISKYAKENGLKAVLSGIGADELFGGYPSFKRIRWVKLFKFFPAKLLRLFAKFSSAKLQRIAYLSIPGQKGEYLFLRGIFTTKDISKILNIGQKQVWETLTGFPNLKDITGISPIKQANWLELNMYMQNQLLRDSDIMSMAHGVEIRVPFLEKSLVEYALSIKTEKFDVRIPKKLLIDSFQDILPKEIWDRPKMGFTLPFSKWVKENPFIISLMKTNKVYNSYFQQFLSGEISWSKIMAILVMEKKLNDN